MYLILSLQWLQENLLCLLSNAVKYSSRPNVRITVSLKDEIPEKAVEPVVDTPPRTLPLCRSCFRSLSAYFSRPSSKALPSAESTSLLDVDSARPGQGYLLFEVEDTGVDIAPDKLKALFSPFQQAQRFAGGTGLGLFSLAKRVEAQHGAYGVRNRDDGAQGCVFWFMLHYVPDPTMPCEGLAGLSPHMDNDIPPMTVRTDVSEGDGVYSGRGSISDCSSKLTESTTPTTSFPPSPCTPLSVLLVDDSVSVVKTTSMMLQKLGHTVDTAVNGADALEKLIMRSYDIVLLDIQVCLFSLY